MIAAQQTAARFGFANKTNKLSVFDRVDVMKAVVEIVGIKYPKDSFKTNYATNDYIDQYRHLKTFYEENAKEPVLKQFITYINMKKFYPIQVVDLSFQLDMLTTSKN